ncbi:MAG TPA: methyltransferase domain-containing protein, partial [Caldilineaceae bacterium]|nr:methyltransferase domain-containing protein [Caldilineaceae bacterium]
MSLEEIQRRVDAVQWFHRYEIVPGVFSSGPSDMPRRAAYFPIPADLRGKRVLDIGAADGYFSFLAEERGAEVTAIDAWPRRGFFLAHELRGSRVQFHQMSVYDLDPARLGLFDLVFCFGVYYHLKKPVAALERIAAVTKEMALLESEVLPPAAFAGLNLAAFQEDSGLEDDPTNWWVPTVANFLATVRAAGFPQAELATVYDGTRAIVRAAKGPRTAARLLDEDLFIVVDSPRPNTLIRGPVEIAGWAVSQRAPDQGVRRVAVYLDHLDDPAHELGTASYPLDRPDLAAAHGDAYRRSGYRFTWTPPPDLAGRHRLHLFVEGECGWNYRSTPVYLGREP